MTTIGPYDAEAVKKFFEMHPKDEELFGKNKSRYTRLVLVKDNSGKERICCRTLKWQERLLAKLGLGGVASRFGYGNANLRDIIKRCPELYVYDEKLLKLIKAFNKTHKLKPISKNYRLLLALPPLRPKNLFNACRAGELSRVEYLVKTGEDINAKNEEGKTLLHLACLHNHLDLIDFILKNGGDVNARDNQGRTPLIDICHNFFGQKEVVEKLLAHKNIAYTDNEGKNALQHALIQGNYDLFLLLLNQGVEIRLLGDALSKNILHNLCFFNRKDILEKLQALGVDLAPASITVRHVADALFFEKYDLAQFFISLMSVDAIEEGMATVSKDLDFTGIHFQKKLIEQLVILVAECAKKNNLEFAAYLDQVVPSKIPESCKTEILEAYKEVKEPSTNKHKFYFTRQQNFVI